MEMNTPLTSEGLMEKRLPAQPASSLAKVKDTIIYSIGIVTGAALAALLRLLSM